MYSLSSISKMPSSILSYKAAFPAISNLPYDARTTFCSFQHLILAWNLHIAIVAMTVVEYSRLGHQHQLSSTD